MNQNCSKHESRLEKTNQRVFNLLSLFAFRLKGMGATKFFEIITHGIAVVGLLAAIDYFSSNPSITIDVFDRGIGYNSRLLREFYDDAGIQIPKPLAKALFQGRYMPKELKTWLEGNHPEILLLPDSAVRSRPSRPAPPIVMSFDEDSDLKIVESLTNNKRCPRSMLEYRIDKLQDHFREYESDRTFHFYYREHLLEEERVENSLQLVESELSIEEKFVALTALIRSREILSEITFHNDGDVCLQNVKIILSSPFSGTTLSRDRNILLINTDNSLPCSAERKDNETVLFLPQLPVDEDFIFIIHTRENKLNPAKDITYSYDFYRVMRKGRIAIVCLIVFPIFIFLSLFWKDIH